jgi:hypothetical protein
VGKPEGNRQLGSPTRRWVDNVMIDLGEVELDDVDSIGLTQDREICRAIANEFGFHKIRGCSRVAAQSLTSTPYS